MRSTLSQIDWEGWAKINDPEPGFPASPGVLTWAADSVLEPGKHKIELLTELVSDEGSTSAS